MYSLCGEAFAEGGWRGTPLQLFHSTHLWESVFLAGVMSWRLFLHSPPSTAVSSLKREQGSAPWGAASSIFQVYFSTIRKTSMQEAFKTAHEQRWNARVLTMFTFTVVSKIKYIAFVFSVLFQDCLYNAAEQKTDEMNTVHITFIMSHVVSVVTRIKTRKVHFIARGCSLQSSFFFLILKSLFQKH